MKIPVIIATLSLFVLAGGSAMAQSQGLSSEAAQGLDPTRADSLSLTTPQTTTEYAVGALTRPMPNHAGADMKDAKDLTKPSVSEDSNEGFSDPSAYLEYKYTQIQDTRLFGPDGPQHTGIVGFDFESFYKTIVGFNFTYSNVSLSDNSAAGTTLANFRLSSDNYFFSPYIAKNFFDWVNVGTSFTYGRTDSSSRTQLFGFGQNDTNIQQDSYTYSAFAGIAHTWGAFSFSSTPTYLYGYNHFEFSTNVPPAFGPFKQFGDAKTLNQTFLWLNNFQYAVTDKLSLSTQINMTQILTNQDVPTGAGFGVPDHAHRWLELGVRADYSFNKDGSVFAAFEHDVFNKDYENYSIRSGVSYNF